MPRKARPIPKQQFPTGLPYGKRQELERQVRSMPMPAPTRPSRPAPQMAGQTAPTVGQQPPVDPMAAIAAQGWEVPQVTPLNAPTQRPGEPVTAGLPIGMGPGPEVLPKFGKPALAQTLQALAEATGDQTFAYLAMIDDQARRS